MNYAAGSRLHHVTPVEKLVLFTIHDIIILVLNVVKKTSHV